MNCTKCNTSGPHEFIDGLCHSCTAKLKNEWCLKYTELAELYSKTVDELQRLKAKENEVCEWQKISTYFCKTSHGVKKNDGDPYFQCCGKKIKIV